MKASIELIYEKYLQFPTVATDTRTVKAGSIFFALKGANFNGNEFAAQALASGAAYAVVDQIEFAINEQYLLVDDVLKALQALANHHRKQLNIPFLGITGSNGKTTSKELINAVLAKKFQTLATFGNLNNHIGVPLSIFKIRENHKFRSTNNTNTSDFYLTFSPHTLPHLHEKLALQDHSIRQGGRK